MALNSNRMQIFFNEFLITNTHFLNKFTNECENKFFEFERKLNRIESNLTIIEAKLQSVKIPDEGVTNESIQKLAPEQPPQQESAKDQNPQNQKATETDAISTDTQQESQEVQPEAELEIKLNFIKISESFQYKKFFKMIKFGVSAQAVKLKMQSEGFDSEKLDHPDELVEKCPEDDVEQE